MTNAKSDLHPTDAETTPAHTVPRMTCDQCDAELHPGATRTALATTVGQQFSPRHSARDSEMALLRSEGWTLSALGRRYGLSRSRVRDALIAREHRLRAEESFAEARLSTRSYNTLVFGLGIDRNELTIERIAQCTYSEIRMAPAFGKVCAKEVAALLWQHGIRMKELPARLRDEFAASLQPITVSEKK